MLKYSWLVFLLAYCSNLGAQVKFSEDNTLFGERRIHSQIPIAIADINSDFLDDIVVLEKGKFLQLFMQHGNQEKYSFFDFGKVANNDQYALNICDIDNDGQSEILCSGYYDGVKVYKKFGAEDIYLKNFTTSVDFYTQNISLFDFNNDNLLDLLISDDEAGNKIFINEDGNTLLIDDEIIDFSTAIESDNSGNYASNISDFDDDGDLDIYVSKCRQGVDSADDPRRINQLFVNQGDGTFVEDAERYGLDNGEQTWVTVFEDLDNDGDKDMVMLNHTGTNLIYENLGDQNYIPHHEGSDFNESFWGLQLFVRDFDNDGLKDIFIAGYESRMYWNLGDFKFERDGDFLEGRGPKSGAIGDFNNDGFWDIYAIYADAIGFENRYISDKVFLNNVNGNNYLKISLRGLESNISAIGAVCKFYGRWGVQTYEIQSGQSYGTVSSRSVIFGLGNEESYDSLIIKWPNSRVSSFGNLELNQHHILQENDCVSTQVSISYSGEDFLCQGEEKALWLPEASQYLWNDGSSAQSLSAKAGIYFATITDEKGCETITSSTRVRDRSDIQNPKIEIVDQAVAYCKDDILTVSTQYEDKLLWSTNGNAQTMHIVVDSLLYVDYQICDTLTSDTVRLEILNVESPNIANEILIQEGEKIEINSTEYLEWFIDSEGGESIYVGENFDSGELFEDTTFYVQRSERFTRTDSFMFRQEPEELSFPPDNVNGGLIFEVRETITKLSTVKCLSNVDGFRKVQLKDFFGNVLAEREVFVGSNDSLVHLDFILPPAEYYLLTTDEEVNEQNLGKKSPLLKRAKYTDSPYNLLSESGNIRLLTSTGTPVDYYSFFDMKFIELDKECESDRVKVEVSIDQGSSLDELFQGHFYISPNPSDGDFLIHSDLDVSINYEIYTISGRRINSGTFMQSASINLKETINGIFILKLFFQDQVILKKLVIN